MKGQKKKKVERGVANMITDTHCPQLTSDDVPITRYHSLSKTANEQDKEKKRKKKMERHFPIQTKKMERRDQNRGNSYIIVVKRKQPTTWRNITGGINRTFHDTNTRSLFHSSTRICETGDFDDDECRRRGCAGSGSGGCGED